LQNGAGNLAKESQNRVENQKLPLEKPNIRKVLAGKFGITRYSTISLKPFRYLRAKTGTL